MATPTRKPERKKTGAGAGPPPASTNSGGMMAAGKTGVSNPFEQMEQVFNQAVERFFHPGWLRDWPQWGDFPLPFEGKFPEVDVIDGAAEVVVRAGLPGVDKDDLDVTLTENSVTIKGSTRQEQEQGDGDYYRREMSRGEFTRTVVLPAQVDGTRARASFRNGMLELVLPKAEKSRRRKIEVH